MILVDCVGCGHMFNMTSAEMAKEFEQHKQVELNADDIGFMCIPCRKELQDGMPQA